MIKRLLNLLAWQDWPQPQRPGVRRADAGRLLVVRSRDVVCPHCRKAHRLDARELRLVDVVGPGGQALHTEIDARGTGAR
jgi:hypothetical protein